MKKIITTIMAMAIMVGLCSTTALAAEDIVLNGDDAGESSFIGEYAATGGEYSYLGFATLKGVTDEYKYLEMTYSGDISTLRLEMVKADESLAGPYWFASNQVMKFVTADGSAIETNVSEETTIVIDLEASGINIGEFTGMHLHFLSPDVQEASFSITDAKFVTATADAADDAETETTDTEAAKTGSSMIPTGIACTVIVLAGAALAVSKKRAVIE